VSGGDPADTQRRAAAERAVERVSSGMVLGFGTGRAAGHALAALGERVRHGLQICGVASSQATADRARALGLDLTTRDKHPALDLTIDGADEVDPQLRLIKGGGGALLREKVLAAASAELLIVVEAAKLVDHLGATRGVPVEVLPFALRACERHVARLGSTPRLRLDAQAAPFVTTNGNWVLDCTFPPRVLDEPARVDRDLRAIPGVLETGLFWSFRPTVFVGQAGGVTVLTPPAPAS
jgi:ribose 5-phosphate isomerase A